MPRRATSTSFGGIRGNRSGNQSKAGKTGADGRLLRKRWREAAAQRLKVLTDIADGTATVRRPFGKDADMIEVEPDFADRIRAMDTLAKHGLGERHEHAGDAETPFTIQIVRK